MSISYPFPDHSKLFKQAIIFLQARISSQRLPGKVLAKVYQKPLLGYLLDRLQTTGLSIRVLVPREEMDFFTDLRLRYPQIVFFGGSKEDVLKRFYDAAQTWEFDHYIRVTGDNPFTSITCLKKLLKEHIRKGADLSYYQDLPHGAGVEILSRRVLLHLYRYGKSAYDREHVTSWLHRRIKNKNSLFRLHSPQAPKQYRQPHCRVTVDTSEDFIIFKNRVKMLRERKLDFSLKNLLQLSRI